MKPKLIINFPGGAGGNWLSNLIFNIETKLHKVPTNNLEYHNSPKSKLVKLTHNIDADIGINYNTVYCFNVYINVIIKGNSNSLECLSAVDKIQLCDNHAENVIKWSTQRIDLDYAWVYTDIEKFVNVLKTLLAKLNVQEPDIEYILRSIARFKETCPDPMLYFADYTSPIWLGWCTGYLRHNNISIDINDQLEQNLEPYKKEIEEFTKCHTLI